MGKKSPCIAACVVTILVALWILVAVMILVAHSILASVTISVARWILVAATISVALLVADYEIATVGSVTIVKLHSSLKTSFNRAVKSPAFTKK